MHSLINCYFIWERLCRINLQHFYAWQSQLGEIRCRSVWIRKSENVWGTQRLPRRAGFLEQVEKTGERVQGQGREAGRSLWKETAVRLQGVWMGNWSAMGASRGVGWGAVGVTQEGRKLLKRSWGGLQGSSWSLRDAWWTEQWLPWAHHFLCNAHSHSEFSKEPDAPKEICSEMGGGGRRNAFVPHV